MDPWMRNCPSHAIKTCGRVELQLQAFVSEPLRWGCDKMSHGWWWRRSRLRPCLPSVTFPPETSVRCQPAKVFVASECYYMVNTENRVNRMARWLKGNVGKCAGRVEGEATVRGMLTRSILGNLFPWCQYRWKWSSSSRVHSGTNQI
jgi:hypothetical protein